MPKPREKETESEFIERFMSSAEAKRDYPNEKQRFAVCKSIWGQSQKDALPMPVPGEFRDSFVDRYLTSEAALRAHDGDAIKIADAAAKVWEARYSGERSAVHLSDRSTTDGVRRTRDGYLVAQARVARTGIQTYRGYEVGRPKMDVVRIYRPEEEVFDRESLASYAFRPMTSDHPSRPVDADNWRELSVGHVGERVARDGEFVSVPLLLMDGRTIGEYEKGKRELSLGYDTELVWGEGVTPSGETYDAVQTNIRANHLAVVAAARGGPDLRIGDEKRSEEMTEKALKTITVDGLPVEVTDMAASVITKMIATHDSTIKQLKDELSKTTADMTAIKTAADAAATEAKKTIEARDAEVATLKKQLEDAKLTPAKLDELVKDRADIVGKARTILGDKLTVDGKTDADIRRQVVDAKMGDTAKGWSDDAVSASFRTICADVKTQERDGLADAFRGGIATTANDAEKAYEAYEKDLQNAWKSQPTTARQ